MTEMPKNLDVPRDLVPPVPQGHKHQGVFLVFLSGRTLEHVQKKIEKVKILVSLINDN